LATFRKRGKTWRVEIKRRDLRESATFGSKAEAQAWATEREQQIAGGLRAPVPHRSVRDALDRYAREVSPLHKGAHWERVRLTKLGRDLPFAGRRLADVAAADIAGWRDGQAGVLAPASIRREFGLLRAVFACARRDWGWLRVSPFDNLKPPPAGRPRTRRVSDDELGAIIAALGTGPVSGSIALACRWALETAMRQGEILRLTRDDIAGRVAVLVDTKNGDRREVPLSGAAMALLMLLPARGRLFPVDPRSFDTLFRKARKRAGVADVHFHDLRREAATRLAAKLDPMTLAKMTGHRDLKVLLATYYAPRMADVAKLLD
jgi:integrase